MLFRSQAVCSGFAYFLSVADAFIRSGAHRRILVIGAETFSRILNFQDRTTCVLFGDGAGAMGFGNYIGNHRVLSMNSGTAALHVALILAGVKPGDEVISTVITAEPTNVAILQAGAKIVWADVDYETGVLSVVDIERKITPATKAIMVVHYAGIPADLDALQALSTKYKIPVIEDAAHALGAKFNGRFIGTHSSLS